MWPVGDHCEPTCVTVRCKGKRIEAVIDTGSEVTIAGTNVAKKHRWNIRPAELQSVKMANGEHMLTEGLTTENFKVGKNTIRSKIYMSPDLNELILGVDWLKKQGRMIWDFSAQQIRFGDGGWIALRQEAEKGCRRVYAERDVILHPKQETIVPVRVSRNIISARAFEAVTESLKIPNMSRVYSSRTVLPAKFSGIGVRVVNTDDRMQVLKKGTRRRKLEPAEVIEPKETQPKVKEPKEKVDVIRQMMDSLPNDLIEEQRIQARQLLQENEATFPKESMT